MNNQSDSSDFGNELTNEILEEASGGGAGNVFKAVGKKIPILGDVICVRSDLIETTKLNKDTESLSDRNNYEKEYSKDLQANLTDLRKQKAALDNMLEDR